MKVLVSAVDMDFEHTRRDEMKDYVKEKYGDAVSIGTFTTLKSKSLVRGIARVLCIPLQEVDEVCKKFNELDEFGESDTTAKFRAAHPEVYPLAKQLEGRISATGMHAAGVVVADRPIWNIVPVETRVDPVDKKKRVEVCAYDLKAAAEVGLIKFDFLGLSTLTVIHDTVRLIKERHGIDIDWLDIPLDDEVVLQALNAGQTCGGFQMESQVFQRLLLEIGVDSFNDIVASNALVRPGAFTAVKSYSRRKKGKEAVEYPVPEAEQYLKNTFGNVLFQEQIMQLSVLVGNFTWAEANKLRGLIGKKVQDMEKWEPWRLKWMENASEKIGAERAKKIWDEFLRSKDYSFNLSHSVCYSYVGFATMWLKCHYPLEFLYGLLKNEKKDSNRTTYLLEAKRLGVPILPPDINKSEMEMSIDNELNGLRFGLSDIKSVGLAACNEILSKRPFNTWDDFDSRVTARACNSRVRASLVAVDAFASVEGAPRHPNPIDNYQEYLSYPIALEKVAEAGVHIQTIDDLNTDDDLNFALIAGVVKSIKRTDTYVRLEIEDLTSQVTAFASMDCDLSEGDVVVALVGETSLVGYTRADGLAERKASGNYFNNFERWLFQDQFDYYQLLRDFGIDAITDQKSLVLPLSVREITTKRGEKMAYLYFSDPYGSIVKATVFANAWQEIKKVVSEWQMVCAKFAKTKTGDITLWAGGIVSADVVLQDKKEKLGI